MQTVKLSAYSASLKTPQLNLSLLFPKPSLKFDLKQLILWTMSQTYLPPKIIQLEEKQTILLFS